MRRVGIVLLIAMLAVSTGNVFAEDTKGSEVNARGISLDIITSVPRTMAYQAGLNDSDGDPVRNTTLDVTFRIFDALTEGNELWTEVVSVTTDQRGNFTAILSNLNLPFDEDYFLELQIEDDPQPLEPRQKLHMSPYAARGDTTDYAFNSDLLDGLDSGDFADAVHDHDADYVNEGQADAISSDMILDGAIQFDDIGQNAATVDQVMKWNGSAWAAASDEVGAGGGNWTITDSVLYTNDYWGIARGSADNKLWGDSAYTMVNLGVACTTGTSGADFYYATISGGWRNKADSTYATVGGGVYNWATGIGSIIGGGVGNEASGRYSTIGGGRVNMARGEYATVAGGGGFDAADSNAASGDYSFVGGGFRHTASGGRSTVSGGYDNDASGFESTVGGGHGNEAWGNLSTVCGGLANRASGYNATLAGGKYNVASNDYATVGGGESNTASNFYSTIGGGYGNEANGNYSTVPGGGYNHADSAYTFAAGRRAKAVHKGAFVWADTTNADFSSTGDNQFLIRAGSGVGINTNSPGAALHVGGTAGVDGIMFPDGTLQTTALTGGGNWTVTDSVLYTNDYWGLARGGADNKLWGNGAHTMVNLGVACTTGTSGEYYSYTTVGGGWRNTATGFYATVSGGYHNTASQQSATIGGGSGNQVGGQYSTVGGGVGNEATQNASTVGGGSGNEASGFVSTVGGGQNNTASGGSSTVDGGQNNTASGQASTVGGGIHNSADSSYATVGGGSYNSASGNYSTVPGGSYNHADSAYTFAAGRRAKAVHKGAFIWADTTDADFSSTGDNQFLVRAGGGVGINTNSPAAALHIGGTAGVDGIMFPDGTLQTTALSGAGNWTVTDSVLYTNNFWGIARGGADNKLWGDYVYTMVNLGYACTTGTIGQNYYAVTVGGGYRNTASDYNSTVGGGDSNTASNNYSTVSGGAGNTAGGEGSTVGGGAANTAGDYASTVGGGRHNFARGRYSVVAGGGGTTPDSNSAIGDYSVISGGARNTASGGSSTIGGGSSNITNLYGTISGGFANQATGPFTSVGGGFANYATDSSATVGGGRYNNAYGIYATVAGGVYNRARGAYSVIAGGGGTTPADSNLALGDRSAVGGGSGNIASSLYSTVGGGGYNTANGNRSTVGGGSSNMADGNWSIVGGGTSNLASGYSSTIGGGYYNSASGGYATVPGGYKSTADGHYSFAAGNRAKANHDGSMVLVANSSIVNSDSTRSGGLEQMVLCADGGIYITNTAELAPYDNSNIITTRGGAYLSGNGTAWTNSSDRNKKENFKPVDGQEILELLEQLEITQWNYKSDDENIKHIGPVAQDFYALFELGGDDKAISTVDPSGVALAGIQALLDKIEQLETRITELEAGKR